MVPALVALLLLLAVRRDCAAVRITSPDDEHVAEPPRVQQVAEAPEVSPSDLERLGSLLLPTHARGSGVSLGGRSHGIPGSLVEGAEGAVLNATGAAGMPTPEQLLDTIEDGAIFVRVWGRDRVLDILKEQQSDFRADTLSIGYTSAIRDFEKLWRQVMVALAEVSAVRPQGTCSELPDGVLANVWRYREEDVLGCLLAGAGAGGASMEEHCDAAKKLVPGSGRLSWMFSECRSVGAEACGEGARTCCCPSGKQWNEAFGKCVDCSMAVAPAAGQTCELRCALLPEVSTRLTCGSGVRLVGEPPEGLCRWSRARAGARAETPLGPVEGLVRPVLWSGGPGVEVSYVRTFWGVPFGKPIERFRRPEPVEPWGPESLKLPDWEQTGYEVPNCDSEGVDDCLTLSVYAPESASLENLRPVMFWITGDGFRSADNWGNGTYDGARYPLRQDALLVIANARSQVLGHWASPVLAAEDPQNSTGNYEMMDQRLALQWIRDNIRSFGGDPQRVTIGGHSSGGFSVNFHLFSPESRGLFSGALAEGSTVDSGWYFQDVGEASAFYADLGDAMGCPKADATAQISCLRGIPKKDFLGNLTSQLNVLGDRMKKSFRLLTGVAFVTSALWSWLGFEGGFTHARPTGEDRPMRTAPIWPVLPVGPCVDGSPAGLPARPSQLMREGAAAQVPIYYDHALDEGTIFAFMLFAVYPFAELPSFTHAGVDDILTWAFGPDVGREVIHQYPHTFWGSSPYARLSDVIRDAVFRCSNERMANFTASRPGAPPVYLAQNSYWAGEEQSSMDYTAWKNKALGLVFGSWHMSATLWAIGFGGSMASDYEKWTPGQQKISQLINCMYGHFLHCRSPEITNQTDCYRERIAGGKAKIRACEDPALDLGDLDLRFPPFDPRDPKKYVIDVKTGLVPIPELEAKKCEFWDRHADDFHFVKNIFRR